MCPAALCFMNAHRSRETILSCTGQPGKSLLTEALWGRKGEVLITVGGDLVMDIKGSRSSCPTGCPRPQGGEGRAGT